MSVDKRSGDANLLEQAVREGGEIAHGFFVSEAETWEKNPDDPVTEADLAVDKHLRETLCGARPEYAWLSEETADDGRRLERPRVWIVDPIDGTRAFVKRRPEYTICAALVEAGRVILGAVFNPETDEFYFAEAGAGATLNGKQLRAPTAPDLDDADLLSSRETLEHLGAAPLPGGQFTFINSIALRMVLIATGRHHASISVKPKSDWDIAAADLIAAEAGLRNTAPDGSALIYNRQSVLHPGVITAAEPLHGEILRRLKAS
jgi:myo-inositol-1(or 4)-monophosphatase